MLAYTLIHNSDPTKYQWGEIAEILPPSPHTKPPDWSLYMAVIQKKYGWRPGGRSGVPMEHVRSTVVIHGRDTTVVNTTFMQVLESIGKFAIGTGLLVWLIRSIMTQLLARDLEKYKGQLNATHVTEIERLKADLHAAAFEHERLHEERIRVIAELYRRLVRVERTLHEVAAAELNMIGEEDEDPKPIAELREALDASDSFRHYFEENRIYFDEALCTAIGTLIKRFGALWRQHALPESAHNNAVTEAAGMRPSLADLRSVIESRVRTMLGVSDESNSVEATEKT